MVECEIVCAVAGKHGEGAEEHGGGECYAGMYAHVFIFSFVGFCVFACLVQMTPMVFWVLDSTIFCKLEWGNLVVE